MQKQNTHLLPRRIFAAGAATRALLACALLAGFSAASALEAGAAASLAFTITAASVPEGCSTSASVSCS